MKVLNKQNLKLLPILSALLVGCNATDSKTAATAVQGPMNIKSSYYATLPNGEVVNEYTLTSDAGLEVSIISYGGIITSLKAPDRNGKLADVVLGYDSIDGYLTDTNYFGALIGRYGNRIGKGQFTIDGVKYQLDTNNAENHLHGGHEGYDSKNWAVTPYEADGHVGLKMQLISPDGDGGFPGNAAIQVDYRLVGNELIMDYKATADKKTHINLTQHSYFNLAGEGDILDHKLTIPAQYITPVDAGLIPTGEFMPVQGTPFDFTSAKAIGKEINAKDQQLEYGLGYDHNWVLNKEHTGEFKLSAKLEHEESGRVLEIYSSEPAIQFYSGNFLNGTAKGKGRTFEHRTGLCLEPQHFPDSPNKPHFPSTQVNPGEVYQMKMSFKFSTN